MKIKIINHPMPLFVSSIFMLLMLISLLSVGIVSPVHAKNTDSTNHKKKAISIDKKIDSDNDGLSDVYERKIGTEAYLADTDGDGLNDGYEVGKNLNKPFNHDNDKRIDALDPDDDNDGLPTILEISYGIDLDTDKDGIKNYLDTDSDNDGVNDGLEAGMLGKDTNFDAVDDAFDAYQKGAQDKNGDGIADKVVMPDQDGDGTVDMLDKKIQYSKNKPTQKKNVETASLINKKQAKKKQLNKQKAQNNKDKAISTVALNSKSQDLEKAKNSASKQSNIKSNTLKKVVVNKLTDSDNDGLLDSLEKKLGTNPKKRDSDGDTVSDAIEIGINPMFPQDSDQDGIIDALDIDDDNDGILTKNEDINKDSSPINDDTDEDGVPNYLDANDDGDARLTIEEGKGDSDNNGVLDYLEKNTEGYSADTKIVVLHQSNQAEFENRSFYKDQHIDQQKRVNNAQAIDAKSIRVTNALEQAIASNHTWRKTASNQIEEGKLAKKKRVSLRNKDDNFISWLTSLLPN